MSHLANALAKYYKKEKGKILFLNNQTLNQLSLQLWEELGFGQVDPSVLSKVINGQRLFTPSQLEAFCTVLGLSTREKDELFFHLNKDYCERYHVELDEFFIAKSTMVHFLRKLTYRSLMASHMDKPTKFFMISSLIEEQIDLLTESPLVSLHERIVYETLALQLYLKSRQLIKAQNCSLYLAENEDLHRVYVSSPILSAVKQTKGRNIDRVYAQQESSILSSKYVKRVHPELQELNFASDLLLPLTHKGKAYGVLSMHSPKEVAFSKEDIAMINSLHHSSS